MAGTDRAFRALARAEPQSVLALLRAALPDFMAAVSPVGVLGPDAVEDPKLDLPPPIEADLVARAGDDRVLHVEGQGYDDRAFERRVFNYHLALVLRHPDRQVTTVALWLVPPPLERRLGRMELSGVTIEVQTIVLRELPASRLLSDPHAVCFAAGADPEQRSSAELCAQVARALRDQGATWQRLAVSAAVAAAAGRYDAMIEAMHEVGIEPPVIEDLVRFGREQGLREGQEIGLREGQEIGLREGQEQGLRQGRIATMRESLLELLALRGLSPSAAQAARIEAESELERLREWFRRAARADSVRDVLAD
jgi:hypothetical protein